MNPALEFDFTETPELDSLLAREWLVTNGLGGYASGTLAGVPTRHFHGLLIPNLPAPRGRTVMVPRLDETLQVGDREIRLTGPEFSTGPEVDGHRYLKEFRLERQTPVWTYEVDGRVIERRIAMPYGHNSVYVRYTLVSGRPARLSARVFISCRKQDGQLGFAADWPFAMHIQRGRIEVHPFETAPTVRMRWTGGQSVFVTDEKISRGVHFRVERERGHEGVESQYSPGYFSADLRAGQPSCWLASTEPWELLEVEPDSIFEAEQRRREKLLQQAPPEAREGWAAQLVLAADQFIILPASRPDESVLHRVSGESGRTIIAGYHWFTDWGRDTMISLEGLTLCTGRHFEARAILLTFAQYVKDGLIPNLFPEGQRNALYNTCDATLWYFHAVSRYVAATGDREALRQLYPTLKSIVDHHRRGTHFGIGVDPEDGLLRAGAPGLQLTWMDAKVDEWVVTPRRGKPVEIQALWHNALRFMQQWAPEMQDDPELYRQLADRAQESFNRRFWSAADGYLFDVLEGDKGADASLRPNQIFALSLPHPILARERWKPVLDAVREHLLTPYGLRTLDLSHRDYHARYEGDRWARDAAYHQGLVWAWLIGPYIDAWMRVTGDAETAFRLLEKFESHLKEAGLGSVSEIFDAEPPHNARGCIAQAWSVAEVLRSLLSVKRARAAKPQEVSRSAPSRPGEVPA